MEDCSADDDLVIGDTSSVEMALTVLIFGHMKLEFGVSICKVLVENRRTGFLGFAGEETRERKITPK